MSIEGCPPGLSAIARSGFQADLFSGLAIARVVMRGPSALQAVIAILIARGLGVPAFDASIENIPDAVHLPGREAQAMALCRYPVEEEGQRRILVALLVAHPGDVSGYLSGVDGDLNHGTGFV